jgi:hypothetical protein
MVTSSWELESTKTKHWNWIGLGGSKLGPIEIEVGCPNHGNPWNKFGDLFSRQWHCTFDSSTSFEGKIKFKKSGFDSLGLWKKMFDSLDDEIEPWASIWTCLTHSLEVSLNDSSLSPEMYNNKWQTYGRSFWCFYQFIIKHC